MFKKEKKVKLVESKKRSVKNAPAEKRRSEKSAFSVSNVVFKSEGLNCAGKLYLPAGFSKPPVIIMGNGLGLEMDFGIPAYAGKFAENGYAVLTFDYRYYGASEGEPRHLLIPGRQLKDWGAAIEFARNLKTVDPERICVWGYSFSGGHVISMAAGNCSVKVFIAHMPHMDSLFIFKISGFVKTMKISAAGYLDLFNSITGRAPRNIPLVGKSDDFAILNTPESYEGYMSLIPADSAWRNEIPARSMLAASFYRPFKKIAGIKCRGLIVTGYNDSLTDNDLVEKSFIKNERFELIKLPCGHFDIFKGEHFKTLVSSELRFLKSVFG